MKIAVNCIFLQKNNLEGYGYFVQETFKRLAQQHPEHEFVFVFDRKFDAQFIYSDNITSVIVSPKARHPLAFKFWYDVKLPLALRSIKPDIIIQPYGFCSLTTSVPQLLVAHDLAFKHYPTFISKLHLFYYKNYTSKFLQKATHIATVSEFSKQEIIDHYKIDAKKINVVFSAAKNIFQPLDITRQQNIKEEYADGKEFFLFTGGIHPRKNLLNTLKAFSLFKKWQQSNMKLLIAGRLAWKFDDVLEKIKTFKYRNDVVLLDYVKEETLAAITASAYGVLYPSYWEGFGVPIVEAMQSGIPVITGNTSSMPEIGGTAALYADANDPDSIAKHMLTLYKDESLRKKLIEEGKLQARKFSWDKTAGLLWQIILNTAQSK